MRDPTRGPLLRLDVVGSRGYRQLGGVPARRRWVLGRRGSCGAWGSGWEAARGCAGRRVAVPLQAGRQTGRQASYFQQPLKACAAAACLLPCPAFLQDGCLEGRSPQSSMQSTAWSSSAERTSWCRCAAALSSISPCQRLDSMPAAAAPATAPPPLACLTGSAPLCCSAPVAPRALACANYRPCLPGCTWLYRRRA